MTTSVTPLSPADYAAAVRDGLGDLPEDRREEVCEDLEAHLAEVAADADVPLTEALGPPEDYARELRASAGLPAPASGGTRRLADQAGVLVRTVTAHPAAVATRRVLVPFWPTWLVVRAAAAVFLLCYLATGFAGDAMGLFFSWIGMAAVALATIASFRIERLRDTRLRWLLRTGDTFAALFVVLPITLTLLANGGPPWYWVRGPEHFSAVEVDPVYDPVLRHADGEPITNIYPYTDDGEPLDGVLLFDGHGRPIETGAEYVDSMFGLESRFERDDAGHPILHRFPLEQYVVDFDDEGMETRRPRPVPRVVLPLLSPEDLEDAETEGGDVEGSDEGEVEVEDAEGTEDTEGGEPAADEGTEDAASGSPDDGGAAPPTDAG